MKRCILFICFFFSITVKYGEQVERGLKAQEHQFPSHLLLHVFEANVSSRFCGATIIYPTYLLTTKQCVKNKDKRPYIEIISGINMTNPIRKRNTTIIKKFIYADTSDIALLQLKEPFGPLYDFPNVPMPHRNYIYVSIRSFDLKEATFCGHGKTETKEFSQILQFVDMTVADDAGICNDKEKFNYLCGVVGDSKRPNYMSGPRKGDEGGGLIFYDEANGTSTLFAIFVGHHSNRYLPKFIYIPYIAEWIEMITNHKMIIS